MLDHDHPCMACGEPWLVQLQAHVVEQAFIVWKQRGTGYCYARCMTRDKAAYRRGLHERQKLGWTSSPLGMRPRPLHRSRRRCRDCGTALERDAACASCATTTPGVGQAVAS
jgi:hypothetical protein